MHHKSITLKLVEFLTPILIFSTPLFFLPFTNNFFGTPQLILVLGFTLILILGLALDFLIHGSAPQSTSNLRLPLILFIGSVIVNLLINPEGRTESLASTATLYLALSIFAYFVSMTGNSSKIKINTAIAFIASSTILAIHGIFQLTILHQASLLPLYMQTKSFTPTGNPVTTTVILLIGAILAFIFSLHQKSQLTKVLSLGSAVIQIVTGIAYISLMLPGGALAPILLPLTATWNITLDSLKNTHNLLFGVGYANFSQLYNSVKPLFLNTTSFWNTLPSSASTEIFQLIITTGLIGTVTFLYLVATGIKHTFTSSSSRELSLQALFLLSTLTLFIIPSSIPGYTVFFISLGLISNSTEKTIELQKGANYILALTLFITIGVIGFYSAKLVSAEFALKSARTALTGNDAKAVYEFSLQAVNQLPTMSNYRLSYSQVNLSIAASLSQQKDLSDEQKQNVSQLITQAVREAKFATGLRPHDAFAWQNLGNIYTNILAADGTVDKLALEAYSQAINLDPANPGLRAEFATLLTRLAGITKVEVDRGNYLTRAASELQIAIQLKPDYPVAYYNLAKLLESAGNYENAYSVMQKAITLLDPTSPDLTKANEDLAAIKAKIPEPSSSPLAVPSPIPQGENL